MDRQLLEVIAHIYPFAISEEERWKKYGNDLRYLCYYINYIRTKHTHVNDELLYIMYDIRDMMDNSVSTEENMENALYREIVDNLTRIRRDIIVPIIRKQYKEGAVRRCKILKTERLLDLLIEYHGD